MKHLGAIALWVAQAVGLAMQGQNLIVKKGSDGLQDIVTYDEHSVLVYGQRIMLFSGEFHPYRLPVPDLWLDVFQKIKSLGFSAVSFYTDWALLEGQPGNYTAEGVFALEPFFEAAVQAGLYLIARPGPYINAESSGGGFPGWLQREKDKLRTSSSSYLAATDNYIANVGKTIAKYQITNGGPVILVQPENEYTGAIGVPEFPDSAYMHKVESQLRDVGIVVPLISNDASPLGYFAPGWEGSGGEQDGNVDIYGFDSYPLGFDCANPYDWGTTSLPTSFAATHKVQSPSTFNSINEFQGGAFDPWGGLSFDQCAILVNMEFERVFFKNNFAARLSLLNLYMTYGGTNWGNLGHAGGYTSYDYGAPISENREVFREKYSELKLQANFLRVSPTYLVASVGNLTNSTYAGNNTAVSVTPLFGNSSQTSNFYIIRHSNYSTEESTNYQLTLPTSHGILTVPSRPENALTLSGRDSKFIVTDYDLGVARLVYSSAEIFTWKQFPGTNSTVLVVYGGPGELNEVLIEATFLPNTTTAAVIEGDDTQVTISTAQRSFILTWNVIPTRIVVQIGSLFIYILDRNSAYNYWTIDFPRTDKWGNFTANTENTTSLIIEAGYLIRNAYVLNASLYINGDLNASTPLRVLGTPAEAEELYFNGQRTNFTMGIGPEWVGELVYTAPDLTIPILSELDWKYIDNLPEIQPVYDDSLWTNLDHNSSNNPLALLTPTSLYASDYGFHTGALVYRGKFTGTGSEKSIEITTQGGSAFGSSVWLNDSYIGSWAGADYAEGHNATYTLPNLIAGKPYVFTVVVDNNGLDENWIVGLDLMKTPRGILNYSLSDHEQADITWKLTGNLGGESYADKTRGPLNEGGLYAERQGFHQPNPPSQEWESGSPFEGIAGPGIAFYSASFKLDLPYKYDIPIFFDIANTTIDGTTADFQAQIYVNGWQFGKYINNIGPQTKFPVPQGILDYHGENWLAVEIWSRQNSGARLGNFTLEAGTAVMTSIEEPSTVYSPSWAKREHAY